MNKLLTIGATVITTLALPTIALTVTPTREAILSLAPDEQILQLADKIDGQRVSTEQTDSRIAEFQSTIDDQQVKLAEQQKLIDEQENQISSIKDEAKAIVVKVDMECQRKMEYTNKRIVEEQENIDNGVNVSESKDMLESLLKIKKRTACN